MIRFVNGEAMELSDDPIETNRVGERLYLHGPEGTFSAVAIRDGDAVLVSYRGRQYRVERKAGRRASAAKHASGELRSPMPGLVVAVKTSVGATVETGDVLVVVEAMKTQQPFIAPFAGTIEELPVSLGDQVSEGSILVKVVRSPDNP